MHELPTSSPNGLNVTFVVFNSFTVAGIITGGLPKYLPGQCRDVDQPTAGLIKDLKQRGLLEDTLVVMVGEFGRTCYGQGKYDKENYGRDHHPRCFSALLAGGGIQGGIEYGQTDDFSYNIVDKPVHVRDLHATLLWQLGLDHNQLSFHSRD